VKDKFVRVRRFKYSWYRLIDFADKLVSIIMIESILKEHLTHLRLILEYCYKKHVVFIVKIDFHWSLFLFNVNIKEFKGILISFKA
jgi:hypothetical protein